MVTHESSNNNAPSELSLGDARSHENATQAPPELDEVFAALGHPRRRYLLHALLDGRSEQTLDELATSITAWEQDEPREAVTAEERDRCRVALYHTHIPKLADAGILDYESDDDVVVRTTNTEQAQAVLTGIGGEADDAQEMHARRTD